MTIIFAPKISHSTGSFAKDGTGRAECDRMSLYCYSTAQSNVKDEFQESETIQIIKELDSCVTAAIICTHTKQEVARNFKMS